MTFLYSHWLALPISTRHALAQAFNIKKKNPTHVVDNEVRDDGYVIGDIESALTMEAMEKYIGFVSPDPWSDVVAKVEGRADVVTAQLKVILKEDDVVEPEIKVEVAPKKVVAKKVTKK